MPSEGWAVELRSDRIDLDDLRESLKAPFEPWVEDYEDAGEIKLILRSKTWGDVEDSSALAAQASLLIDRLNGAKPLLNDDARPISAGQFFRFGPDEKPMPFFIAAIGHITLGVGRARGRIEVISTEPPAPPKPSLLQAWLQAADHDDARSDLFTHLARCDNWYDIYKAAEIIRRIAGNKHKLDALLGSDKVEWERVWRTANTNRHAPDPIKYAPPTNPATLSDARGMILRAAGLVV